MHDFDKELLIPALNLQAYICAKELGISVPCISFPSLHLTLETELQYLSLYITSWKN